MMKKLFAVAVLMFSVVFLSGCGSSDKNPSENNTGENKTMEKTEDISKKETKKDEPKKIFKKEFTMNVEIIEGEKSKGKIKISRNGDNFWESVEGMNMGEGEDMPFKPLAFLKLKNETYMQVDIKSEKVWISMGGIGGDQMMPFDQEMQEMFDMEKFKSEAKKENLKKNEEKINGKELTCYIGTDGTNIKTCINEDDGYIAYLENNEEGEKYKMIVSDFEDEADDNLFKKPSNIKSMKELMGAMGQ